MRQTMFPSVGVGALFYQMEEYRKWAAYESTYVQHVHENKSINRFCTSIIRYRLAIQHSNLLYNKAVYE